MIPHHRLVPGLLVGVGVALRLAMVVRRMLRRKQALEARRNTLGYGAPK